MRRENMRMDNANTQANQCGIDCISWSAIIVGAFLSLGLSFLLNLFSTAIGLSVYHFTEQGMGTLAVGGVIGLAIGSIVVLYFSGWVAGFLGRNRCCNKSCGCLYGIATWCLGLVLLILLANFTGHFLVNFISFLVYPTYLTGHIVDAATTEAIKAHVLNPGALSDILSGTSAAGSFAVFILFFLGAIACTYGGHCGIQARSSR